jgi:hypothetical protein
MVSEAYFLSTFLMILPLFPFVPLLPTDLNVPSSNRNRAFRDVLQFCFDCLWDGGFDTAKDLGVFRALSEAACVPKSGVQDALPMMSHMP